MKYAYPQDPTHAVSAIRRYDESSDSSTSQSSLERQQDIAVVGETVPLIFCHRFDWGDDYGANGGVWISPRLIQLGIEQTDLSMMYLLSQGKVEGLQVGNVYWGYQKLQDRDPSAQMCYAYEEVPACLDLDYVPGGSLSWTTTIVGSGPNVGGGGSFTTADNCIRLVITFNSVIEVKGNGVIVGGYDGRNVLWGYNNNAYNFWPFEGPVDTAGTTQGGAVNDGFTMLGRIGDFKWVDGVTFHSVVDFSEYHKSSSWEQTSEVRYNWRVVEEESGSVVQSGQIWIQHGTQSLSISVPQGKYTLEFYDEYKERGRPVNTYTIPQPNPENVAAKWYDVKRAIPSNTFAPGSGFMRYTSVGNETQQISTTVTQTILNVLEFPDLPGGDQQLVGGLSDLTMVGIAGNITALRPQDGPDYFIQSHIFVEQGIEVERLTWGGTGSSPFYGDLVNYLFQQTKILKDDQIDRDSLILANRMTERYKLYFNGVLQTTNSLSEWVTRTAPYFLLSPRQVDGKYGLWPVCPVDGNYELSREQTVPVLTVTRDDIVVDTYERTYASPKERRPVCLVMVYRDQPVSNVGQTVTVEVRYPGTALDGPYESHDLTEFCCRAEQAVYAARYILAKRRYTTHQVTFVLGRRAAQLKPGDVIKIDLAFDTTEGDGITDSTFYQIESLAEGQGGTVAIEATHFPTATLDGVDDVSVIAYETAKGDVQIL